MPKYSLIIPIYNEEESIPELYRRVSDVMDSLDDSVELILINDGSRDCSLNLMRELQERDARVCYISFARNFGHQAAVTAVKFERDPRFAGEVKYTFKKSLALAINSLVSFSKIPLRLST